MDIPCEARERGIEAMVGARVSARVGAILGKGSDMMATDSPRKRKEDTWLPVREHPAPC